MNHNKLLLSIAGLLTCLLQATAQAETIRVEHVTDLSGFEVTLTYDPAAASGAPDVKASGLTKGWMVMANTQVAGTVRVGGVSTRPAQGSGALAELTWPGGQGAQLTVQKASGLDPKGKTVELRVWLE